MDKLGGIDNNDGSGLSKDHLRFQIWPHSLKGEGGPDIEIFGTGVDFTDGGNATTDSVNRVIQESLYDTIRNNLTWIDDNSKELEIIKLIENLSVLYSANDIVGVDGLIKIQSLKNKIKELIKCSNISGKDKIINYIEKTTDAIDRPEELSDVVLGVMGNINTKGRELYTTLTTAGELIGVDILEKKLTIDQLLEAGKINRGDNELILVYQGVREDILSLLKEEHYTLPQQLEN